MGAAGGSAAKHGAGAAATTARDLQQEASAADLTGAPPKWYDVLDVRSGIRRLEAHTQRLAATHVRRERARERLDLVSDAALQAARAVKLAGCAAHAVFAFVWERAVPVGERAYARMHVCIHVRL